jgi:hypothetical protein
VPLGDICVLLIKVEPFKYIERALSPDEFVANLAITIIEYFPAC